MRKFLAFVFISASVSAVNAAGDYEWSCYGLTALKNSSGIISAGDDGVPVLDSKYIVCLLNRNVEFMYKVNGVIKKVPGIETVGTTGLVNCIKDSDELIGIVKKAKKDFIKVIDYKDVADTFHYISYYQGTRQTVTLYDRTHKQIKAELYGKIKVDQYASTFEHHNIIYNEENGKNKDFRTVGTYINLTKEVDGKRSHYIECDF